MRMTATLNTMNTDMNIPAKSRHEHLTSALLGSESVSCSFCKLLGIEVTPGPKCIAKSKVESAMLLGV